MKRLDELFDLRYGQSLELNSLVQVAAPEGVNFVSRAMGNNGVTARVNVSGDRGRAGEITVALSGNGVLSSFVQPEDFVTGFHVMILSPKNPAMTLVEKLWWCRCIWENRHRFSYGRQANRTLGSLLVPDSSPDWVAEMKIPTNEGLGSSVGKSLALTHPSTWASFMVQNIFTISSGKYVPATEKTPGATPEVTSSANNNGRRRYISLKPNFPAGTLSVARNGSVGTAFYQPEPFFATDDVRVWTAKKGPLTRWEGLFVTRVIELETFRYTYGRKWSLEQMRETVLRLPSTAEGEPDWHYMDSYMKGLPFSAAIADSPSETTEA